MDHAVTLDFKSSTQVAKRLETTSRYFKRLGSLGFWGQLVCTIVAAVILSFSVVVTGKITSPATFYSTAGGIVAGFLSVFWSFGYIRLADRLRKTATDPSKAPPRADVVKSLKNGITVNLLGMGAAILGMQATVGLLVAKALTTSSNPYYQGITPGSSPVLALDVFLVQASANTILSHFLGLVFSLELLRSVTLPTSDGCSATLKLAKAWICMDMQERLKLQTARLCKLTGINPFAGCSATLKLAKAWICMDMQERLKLQTARLCKLTGINPFADLWLKDSLRVRHQLLLDKVAVDILAHSFRILEPLCVDQAIRISWSCNISTTTSCRLYEGITELVSCKRMALVSGLELFTSGLKFFHGIVLYFSLQISRTVVYRYDSIYIQ
ncbi:hypothetical protein CTI12_AA232960 [Artemisia annua]|uniref:Translocon at inner membrane of chloroplasts 21 n=1 Tax=Artemisia annua TaxID=35608 RepID=A0A2U1MLJ2_ARTAN|nr:hypothetical protein CTI12_AA232960 [Artemisia annua]